MTFEELREEVELLRGQVTARIEERDAARRQIIDTDKLTRLTVVFEEGRVIEQWNQRIELSVQDDGRTLKVFSRSKNGASA